MDALSSGNTRWYNHGLGILIKENVISIVLVEPFYLDQIGALQIGRLMIQSIKDIPNPQVTVDLGHLIVIHSTFLGQLIALQKNVRRQNGRLQLINVSGLIIVECLAVARLQTDFFDEMIVSPPGDIEGPSHTMLA